MVACYTRVYTPLCPSIGWLVGQSIIFFSSNLQVVFALAYCYCPNTWLAFFISYHCPCPSVRDLGSCVSGLHTWAFCFSCSYQVLLFRFDTLTWKVAVSDALALESWPVSRTEPPWKTKMRTVVRQPTMDRGESAADTSEESESGRKSRPRSWRDVFDGMLGAKSSGWRSSETSSRWLLTSFSKKGSMSSSGQDRKEAVVLTVSEQWVKLWLQKKI